jgi:hypothetical protein
MMSEPSIGDDLTLEAIKTAWDTAPNDGGVIIGSLDFDKVGLNPDTGYDPITTLKRIVDYIGIGEEKYYHVVVVMNYRTPKVGHWSDVYSNHFDDGRASYTQFLCGDQQGPKKWEWLDTVMNPLKVAQAYFDEGYNVRMVDMTGTFHRNQDPAHVVACRVLEVDGCDDNDYVIEIGTDPVINPNHRPEVIRELSDIEQDELEAVFHQRDCYYKYSLHHHERFVMYNAGTDYWRECGGEQFMDYYSQFTDTNFMVQILQSQKSCVADGNNIDVMTLLNDRDNYGPDGTATARPTTTVGSPGAGSSTSKKHLFIFFSFCPVTLTPFTLNTQHRLGRQ